MSALAQIAIAILLGLFLLFRLRQLAEKPEVSSTSYPESVKLVSALVGARSRDRVAEELLELITRSLGLKRLVFLVPETARITNRKIKALGAGGTARSSGRFSIDAT